MAKIIFDKIGYSPSTGHFFWKVDGHGIVQGQRAGSVSGNGYRQVWVFGKNYLEHRLAFLFMTGEMPNEVDHINRDKSDNRWCNLRACTRSENQKNKDPFLCSVVTSKTGIKGVYEKRPGYYYFKGRDGKDRLHTRDLESLRHYSELYWAEQKELLQSRES